MARRIGTKTRSSPRRSSRARSVVQAQKAINRDYLALFRNYEKLALRLWNKPATRYVVSGAAIATLIPLAMRVFRRYPQINTFIRDNMDVVEDKLETVGELIGEKISELRTESSSDEDFTDARH